jgi:L-histidine Nalpha-methyltransferase
MSSVANVTIHASQFPENVRRDLLESLRTGEVNHKFHYDSIKQTQKWLALHHAYSPSRTDPDCAAIYNRSFEAMTQLIEAKRVHLIGLGCGGGQKDTRLLGLLQKTKKEVFYTPSDVSTAMVLVARGAAMEVVPEENCYPLVCDLATVRNLPEVLDKFTVAHATRIITFFGMIPNFEPGLILPKLSTLLRSEDLLLFSANLAPGTDCAAGVRKVLPLYDNALTRDWLISFLFDLGIEPDDGEMSFRIEDDRNVSGLKRIAVYFQFNRKREIVVQDQQFQFGPGKPIRLFFSYRHTPKIVRSLLGNYGIDVVDEWVAKSEEEGVFLCKRK